MAKRSGRNLWNVIKNIKPKEKTLASPPPKPDTRVTPIQERSG